MQVRELSLAVALLGMTAVWSDTAEAAVTCDTPVYQCTKTQSFTIGGFQLLDFCVEAAGTQQCHDDDPLNQCAKLEVSLKCTKLGEECIDYQNGQCRQTSG